ncbi:hypothetical protein ERJ75_001453200 [Trypanosoma vivax]|uniref:Trypanosoma glutamic acid/alanine-rich protein domain-containing protein n=1 Tax=Trypanosoma vivax (strain Y486) TaxID=1055687 RepID=F9WQ86_TRYVY|nr:hypothetical protein ERJ75_001453200 [Trypanosoma vivax]CCD19713.1 hypothetical protein, conserved [Trypanosoma vivax Y486]|eukprot:CCD19713.1 hypothetical protein, conserved [Trypanosoma vivax Y486]
MTAARRALCVLCAALCGAVARANITAEDDEIQVELTNETSVVSVCALSNLLSGVSVSSGSLYRGVSNLPSVANYTVNQTSDGLRRAVAAIEHARGAVSRLAGSEGADADEVQRAKAAVADADKAHAAATKAADGVATLARELSAHVASALVHARAAKTHGDAALAKVQNLLKRTRDAEETEANKEAKDAAERCEHKADWDVLAEPLRAAVAGASVLDQDRAVNATLKSLVANMVELERDAGAARLAMDALRVKGEEAREQLLHATAAANAALAVVDEAQPPAPAGSGADAEAGGNGSNGAERPLRWPGAAALLLPALTHVAPP